MKQITVIEFARPIRILHTGWIEWFARSGILNAAAIVVILSGFHLRETLNRD
jgi:hypothetical protein